MSPLAVSFGSVLGLDAVPPEGVYLGSDRFQMVWIAAERSSAEMVKLQPFGDRPDQSLIRESVSADTLAIDADLAVSPDDSAGPYPAPAVRESQLRNEAFKRRWRVPRPEPRDCQGDARTTEDDWLGAGLRMPRNSPVAGVERGH